MSGVSRMRENDDTHSERVTWTLSYDEEGSERERWGKVGREGGREGGRGERREEKRERGEGGRREGGVAGERKREGGKVTAK